MLYETYERRRSYKFVQHDVRAAYKVNEAKIRCRLSEYISQHTKCLKMKNYANR